MESRLHGRRNTERKKVKSDPPGGSARSRRVLGEERRIIPPFRFRRLGFEYLITGESGEFAFVSRETLEDLAEGGITPEHPAFGYLEEKGFAGENATVERLARRYKTKFAPLFHGPTLHIVIPTLRCNQSCPFCHASRKPISSSGSDMSSRTARGVVDLIFETPAEDIVIEFQGGEPLANFKTVRLVTELARQRNGTAGKRLSFSIVTNTSLLTQGILDYLMSRRFQICTSIDGPEDLHDAQRPLPGGGSHRITVGWMRKIDEAYLRNDLDPILYQTEALCTVTRLSLGRPADIVDEYARLGRKAVFLRPLNPFGFAAARRSKLGYGAEEFARFYLDAFDHIVELNRRGVEMIERTAAIYLVKILNAADPNYLDVRSPCGAGIGQLAYNHDGAVYTCDEGRMLGETGDGAFIAGCVEGSTLAELVASEAVTACCVTSCLDGLPACSDCAYKPYCGVCPVFNYSEQGNLFGRMPENFRCKVSTAILDRIFSLLRSNEAEMLPLFTKWATCRDRPFFYECPP